MKLPTSCQVAILLSGLFHPTSTLAEVLTVTSLYPQPGREKKGYLMYARVLFSIVDGSGGKTQCRKPHGSIAKVMLYYLLPLSLGKKVAERNFGEIKRTYSRLSRVPKIPDRLGKFMMKHVRNLNPRD
jgi:hypothetical protein